MTVNSTRADIAAAFDPAEVRSIRRDAAALEWFYLAHYDDVVRYLTSRVADPHDVADLVADTFIAAVEAAESYDGRRGRVLPWLIGIAHNKVRRWYRQRGIVREVARRVVGRRLLDTDRTARGAVERRVASGHAPSASLTVENALRSATNTVIAKIWASVYPASRNACTSAPQVRLGRDRFARPCERACEHLHTNHRTTLRSSRTVPVCPDVFRGWVTGMGRWPRRLW